MKDKKYFECAYCKYADTNVFTPKGGFGCCNITIETVEGKLEIGNLFFDVAETLRDDLTAWLEAEEKGDNNDESK